MRSLITAIAAATALSAATPAHAGGFTPWGTGTGANNVALSPYLFVGGDGTTTIAPYVFFGAHDHFDVMVGYGFSLTPRPGTGNSAFSSGAIELMPRAVINDYAVIALHTLYTPGSDNAVLGLEFHGVAATDVFALTYNTGWWPTLGGTDGFSSGDWFAILAPEFIINDRFSLFAEFNPSVTLADGTFGATVVPGVTVYVDKAGEHSITAAATLSVAPTWAGATFGLLYWSDFELSKRKARSIETSQTDKPAAPPSASRSRSRGMASLQPQPAPGRFGPLP